LNISSIRNADVDDAIDDLKVLVKDIQANMEKDQYESLSSINKRIKELDTVAYGNVSKIEQSNKVFNKNVTDAFNEIMQLKNTIKFMAQDPNMTSNY
jgi:hypothetical protein